MRREGTAWGRNRERRVVAAMVLKCPDRTAPRSEHGGVCASVQKAMTMQIEMTIKGLMVDPITNMPIVILRDKEGQRVLPIWVGIFEANAIAIQIEYIATPPTMTTDLRRKIINDLIASVQ